MKTAEQLIQENPRLKAAVLAAVPKGARSDQEAVKHYRATRDAIIAALPMLREHFAAEFRGDSDTAPTHALEKSVAELASAAAARVFTDGNPFSHVEDAWADGFSEGFTLAGEQIRKN